VGPQHVGRDRILAVESLGSNHERTNKTTIHFEPHRLCNSSLIGGQLGEDPRIEQSLGGLATSFHLSAAQSHDPCSDSPSLFS
jgi:hypothetical protein